VRRIGLDLLPDPATPVPSKPVRRIVAIARRGGDPALTLSFLAAFLAHAVLLGSLAAFRSWAPARSGPVSADLKAVRQALAEISRNPDDAASLRDAARTAGSEELARTLDRFLRLSRETDQRKKVEIIKAMLRSFGRVVEREDGAYLDLSRLSLSEIQSRIENGSIRLPSGDKLFASASGDAGQGFEIASLGRDEEAQLARWTGDRDRERTDIPVTDGQVNVRNVYSGAKRIRPIPSEVYFRECPYERILAVGSSLFTAVRGFPDLLSAPVESRNASSPSRKSIPMLFNVRLMDTNAALRSGKLDLVSPSAFDPVRIAGYLDMLMNKGEGEQFSEFERDYLKRHDPDEPKLASLVKLFVSTNLNGVFYTADDFTTAFDFLEELYYKRPIYDAYFRYWKRHPKTAAGAEFLFSLAAAYDFERRVLVFLYAVDFDEIVNSPDRSTSAFDYRAKAFVLKNVAAATKQALLRSGYPSVEAALQSYQNASESIYRLLANMGADVGDRALFNLGASRWDAGDVAGAFSVWRSVRPSFKSAPFQVIKPYLASSLESLSKAIARIDNALASESMAGSDELLRRQLRFHKWTNRIAAWKEREK
jgi:hypothetical protein